MCVFGITLRLTNSRWHHDFVETLKCSFFRIMTIYRDFVKLAIKPCICHKK